MNSVDVLMVCGKKMRNINSNQKFNLAENMP